MRERRALARVTASKYRLATKKQKAQLLGIFVEQTGLCRKYASWLLRNWGRKVWAWLDGKPVQIVVGVRRPRRPTPARPRRYDRPVLEALKRLWYLFDCMCGKRLVVVLRTTLDQLAELGELKVEKIVKEKLEAISPATIDRMLASERRRLSLKGRSHTKPGSLLKHQIPIRTFSQWDNARVGFVEIDLVGHDGGYTHGDFAFTLNATDVATGWTEMRAVLNKAQIRVFQALRLIQERLPFALLGIDSDNGGEFINDQLTRWCKAEEISFTRSRPYRKEDTCYVEQKNWMVVRRVVGYQRHDTEGEVALLNELYEYLRLLVNFFYPSMKLISKTRQGSKVRKRYDKPKTPCQRLLDDKTVDEATKCSLRVQRSKLNPIEFQRQIDRILGQLQAIALAKRKVAPYLRRAMG